MGKSIDYKVDILILGSTKLPADMVYNGKYKSGELTTDAFGVTAVRGDGRNDLIDCGSNMADPVKQSIYFGIYHCEETMGTLEEALALGENEDTIAKPPGKAGTQSRVVAMVYTSPTELERFPQQTGGLP